MEGFASQRVRTSLSAARALGASSHFQERFRRYQERRAPSRSYTTTPGVKDKVWAVLWCKQHHVATLTTYNSLPFTRTRSPTEASVLAATVAPCVVRGLECLIFLSAESTPRLWNLKTCGPSLRITVGNKQRQFCSNLEWIGIWFCHSFLHTEAKKKNPTVMYFRRWISYLSTSLQQVPRLEY